MTTSNNFTYITGGTVPAGSPTYIERAADRQLLEALNSSEFCYVLDTRQVGKSSLMVRAASRLRETGAGVAVLDLTAFGQNATAEQWYYGMLLELGNQLGIREELQGYWRANREIGPLQRWMEAVRQVVLPSRQTIEQKQVRSSIVIFVDEIDAVLGLPFDADEFFAAIRSCYTRRAEDPEMKHLVFCLLGSATPDSLIKNVRTTPFNVGRRIELTDFTREEAAPLASGLFVGIPNTQHAAPSSAQPFPGGRAIDVEQLRIPNTGAQRLLDRILYWTGGHPYLTQRLCAAAAADASIISPSGIDRLCETMFFSRKARETEANLSFVGSRLLRSGEDIAALLDLYAQVRGRKGVKEDPSNPLHAVIKLSGLARPVEGYLWVRNRIYFRAFDRDWITANMPNAELQRQRRAARRATIRTAAIAGNIAFAMLGLAAFGLVQAGIAKRNAAELAKAAYDDVMSGVGTAIDSGNSRAAYDELTEVFAKPYDTLRSFEWGLAANQMQDATKTVALSRGPLDAVAWAPSGNTAAVGIANTLVICSAKNFSQVLPVPAVETSLGLFYAPKGDLLCAVGKSASTLLTSSGHIINRISFSSGARPLSFTRDGSRLILWMKSGALATASLNRGEVETPLVSRATGELLRVVETADGAIRSIRQNGPRLTLSNWRPSHEDIQTIAVPRVLQGQCESAYLSTINDSAILCYPDQALLIDGRSGSLTASIDTYGKDVRDVSFSPNGDRAALSNFSNFLIHVIDTHTGTRICDLHGMTEAAEQTAWSPDGRQLISVGDDGFIRLWNPDGGGMRISHAGEAPARSPVFLPASRRLFASFEKEPGQVINADDGTVMTELEPWGGSIHHAAVSRDGITLVGANGSLATWDVRTGRVTKVLDTVANGVVLSVALADMDRLVIYSTNGGPGGGSIIARSLNSGSLAWRRENQQVRIVVSRDGRLAASIPLAQDVLNPAVTLFDPMTGKPGESLKGHFVAIVCGAFTTDGRFLFTGDQTGKGIIWDVKKHQQLHVLRHTASVLCAVFTSDGRRVITGDENGKVCIWNAATGRLLRTIGAHTGWILGLAVSDDGLMLASVGRDGVVKVWKALPSTSPPPKLAERSTNGDLTGDLNASR